MGSSALRNSLIAELLSTNTPWSAKNEKLEDEGASVALALTTGL